MKKNVVVLTLILIAGFGAACANAVTSEKDENSREEIVIIQADYPFYESVKAAVNSADLIFTGKIISQKYELTSEMTKNLKPEIEYLFLAKSFKNTYPSLINDTQSFYDLNDKDNTELNEILKIIG